VEFTPAAFLSALLAIIVIDLVLAGDNAIVIALAARNVPRHLQRSAIIWGTVGAIVVRAAMTMLVVWLLGIPGLLFTGGAILVWIAYKLLLPEEAGENGARLAAASSFWGAIRTIVFADIVMGMDNVLAVAGAAHGSFALVIAGLVISIPIVVWGSTMIMRVIDRFPLFVYVGAGVLAWTAAKMMASEPLLAAFYHDHRPIVPLMYLVLIIGVLWAGFVKNHRRLESRITARLAKLGRQPVFASADSHHDQGDKTMTRVLVPVDDSPNARHAVRHVVNQFMKSAAMEVHLLNIQPPFSRHIARFVSRRNRAAFHREQGEKALQSARRLLENHGVPYAVHIEIGDKAKVIVSAARRLRCGQIVMATARKNSLTRMIEDSTTNKVLELTTVPVEVISGEAVSPWERYGIPVGLSSLLALLLAAIVD
jgi:YjbE family integral membrane protein